MKLADNSYMLTDAEEAELWERYKTVRDVNAREKIILRYAHFVKYVAGKVGISMPSYVDFDDLVSYGIFGLIDAIEKYDHKANVKFVTYAQLRIRGAILDGLRVMDWAPRNVRSQVKKLEKVLYSLEQEYGRTPTDEEIANELEISMPELEKIYTESQKSLVASLDEFAYEDDNSNMAKYQMIENLQSKNPELKIEYADVKRVLIEAIDKLTDQEKQVVSLYYYNDLTIKEIANIMELSDSRVSQLHTKSILRLRGRLSRLKDDLVN
jgi:RNA polymerase sigma factor for flagellar operon FliA